MKILIINVFRSNGSTGKIISLLGEYLSELGDEVIYVYRDGPNSDYNTNFRVGNKIETAVTYRLNYLLGTPYENAWGSTYRILSAIRKCNPDIIALHSINGAYVNIPYLLNEIAKTDIPIVFTHHSEYLFTGNCVYSYDCNKWKNGCSNCEHLKEYHLSMGVDTTERNAIKMKKAMNVVKNQAASVAVSEWIYKRAIQSPILKGIPQFVVENGVDENIYHPYKEYETRKNFAPNGEKIVFFSTAIFTEKCNDRKGGRYVLELAKKSQKNNIVFLVAALEIDITTELPENVKLLGTITNQVELAKTYSMADTVLLTSSNESFSMPTAESLMCGTPVVGFNAGGPESIALSEYSLFCEYGNVETLYSNLLKIIERNYDSEMIANAAKRVFSKNVMGQKYREIYNQLLLNKKAFSIKE